MNSVLVRGHVSKLLFGLRIVAVLALLAGIVLLFVERTAGVATIIPALVVWLLTEARIAYVRRTRQWVTATDHGFHVRDALGERTFEDDDIVSLDLDTRNIYSQGVFKGVNRTFRVKVAGETRALDMRNRIKVGESDPLGPLISRNIDKYRERADEALGAGVTLAGKGWSITEAGLAPGGNSAIVPFGDLQAVGLFDGHVCVWKQGVDEAIVKVPARSENAFLLQLLLTRRIPDRDYDPATDNQEGLGRVLFERKGSRVARVLLWLLAGLLLPLSLAPLAIGLVRGKPAPLLTGLGMAVMGAISLWGVFAHRKWVFRCHERGVFKRGTFSEARLRYADVESFSYSATRQYYNGVYIGTALSMVLTPRPGMAPRPIKFSQSVQNADEDLDELRNHISRVLAQRMLVQLAAGEHVPWTRHLTILPKGIEYRPSGFVGRKEPVLLPFEQLHAFDIQQGTFHLWEKGKEKSVLQESVGEANFFPGYFALSLLYSEPSESPT